MGARAVNEINVQAARSFSEETGKSVEILDLRTLSPYDWNAIAESVKKTSRAVVVYEDPISWGYGAEIAARISSELFPWLDAPVERVAATDTFVAYQPQVEDFILPQASHIVKALDKVLDGPPKVRPQNVLHTALPTAATVAA